MADNGTPGELGLRKTRAVLPLITTILSTSPGSKI